MASETSQPNPLLATASPSTETRCYGWVMMGVAACAMVATLPGRTHGLGMITERLLADAALGIDRATYGQINLGATLLGALFCFGIGPLIDRFGTRRCLVVVMVLLGATVVSMTRLQSVWTLFVAVTLTRGLGQSALSVVSITIVGKWFPKRVTLPMAVYAVLMALGFILAALVGREYAETDWRWFWGQLGWVVLGAGLLLTVLARDPSSPPGAEIVVGEETRGEREPSADVAFTHREALKTPLFWVCAASISLYGLIVSGISLFNESILVERGFDRRVYYESLAWGTGIGVVAKLAAGGLGRRISVQWTLAAALLLLGISLAWLTILETYFDVMVYVVLSAVAGGVLTVLFFSVWPLVYGTVQLGRIQGSAQMMTVVASAFGPLLFAQVKQWWGSYTPLISSLAVVVFCMGGIALWTPTPLKSNSCEGTEHVV